MKTISRLFILSIFYLLIACAEGGMGGTGLSEKQDVVSYGTISNVTAKEVTVQNTRYKMQDTAIRVNSQTKDSTDLKIGMIARIEGSIEAQQTVAVARQIDINNTISGQITEVRQDNSIVVLGHVIKFDNNTHYKNVSSAQNLSTGMQISIMGFVTADGDIRATFVDNEDTGTSQKVSGYIAKLDQDKHSFDLGNLHVDYSSASLSETLLAELRNGTLVEVEGSIDTSSNRFIAHEIEFSHFSVSSESEDTKIELEGIVAAKISDTEFVLMSTTILITEVTVFESGSAANIRTGLKVEVEGKMQNGFLYARKIKIEDESEQESDTPDSQLTGSSEQSTITNNGDISNATQSSDAKILSVVTSIDGNEFKLAGLANTVFTATDATQLDGVTVFQQININDTVEIEATKTTSNTILTRLKLKETGPVEDIMINAGVDNIETPNIWVLGSPINLTGVAVNGGNLDNFLITLQSATGINLQGKLSGSTVQWKEADYLGK